MPALDLLLLLAPFVQAGAGEEGPLALVEREILRVVERVRPAVASIEVDRAFPLAPVSLSGFSLDGMGTFVTAAGALPGARRVSVHLADGRRFRGIPLGTGPGERVGLIRVEAFESGSPPLGNSDLLRPGSIVIAVGNPFGLRASVSFGCVSGVDRTVSGLTGLLQTSVPVNRGDAGGALANSRGEIVGMLIGRYETAAPAAPSLGGLQWLNARTEEPDLSQTRVRLHRVETSADDRPEGIHFALPINRLREEARAVLEKGGRPSPSEERRRWLGVFLEEALDPALRSQLGLADGRGVLVREVYEGSPASRGGLRPHDVLVGLEGLPVGSVADLRRRLDAKPPGALVRIEVMRRGAAVPLEVTLE